MASSAYPKYNQALCQAALNHSNRHGAALIKEVENAAALLLSWLSFLRSSGRDATAGVLLTGTQAAVMEVAGSLALGFVRQAVFSIRAEVDMVLAWLFFKDHPIEWQAVEDRGEHYKLKGEVLKYLGNYFPRFEKRLKILETAKSGGLQDPYGLLSAHVHSQNSMTLPILGKIESLVSDYPKCQQCVKLQLEVSEYLSDLLMAVYGQRWIELPLDIQTNTKKRLSATKLKELCT